MRRNSLQQIYIHAVFTLPLCQLHVNNAYKAILTLLSGGPIILELFSLDRRVTCV